MSYMILYIILYYYVINIRVLYAKGGGGCTRRRWYGTSRSILYIIYNLTLDSHLYYNILYYMIYCLDRYKIDTAM